MVASGQETASQEERAGKEVYLPAYTVFNHLNFTCAFITQLNVTFKKHKF